VVARLAGVANPFTSRPLNGEELLVRLLGGAALGALAALLSELSSRVLPGARAMDRALAELVGPMGVQEALIVAGLSGLGEELLFRGALQSVFGLWPACLLFMLAHLPPRKELVAWTVTAGIAGVGLGFLTVWTGDIVAAVAAHATLNAISLQRLGKMSGA